MPRRFINAAMTAAWTKADTRMIFTTVASSLPSEAFFSHRESAAAVCSRRVDPAGPGDVLGESPAASWLPNKPSPAPATLSRWRHSRLCLCTRYRTAKKAAPGTSKIGASAAYASAHARTVTLNACCPGRSNAGRNAI